MKKIFLYLLLVALTGCSVNNKEVHFVDVVDVYDSPEENLRLSQNLLAYDFRNELIEELGSDFESKIAGKISVGYFVQESNSKTSMRVTTNNLDKEVADQFIPFYTNYIKGKKEEHFNKKETIEKAEQLSEDLLLLIDEGELDSLWSYASPTLLQFTSKEEFLQMLDSRETQFTEKENRELYRTRVIGKINEMQGDFYSINHLYRDGYIDEIVFENSDGILNILGYTMHIPN